MINKVLELDWKVQISAIVAIVFILYLFKNLIVSYLKKKFNISDMKKFGELNKNSKVSTEKLLDEYLKNNKK